MDLVGEMILDHLTREHPTEVTAKRVCPAYHHRLARLPGLKGRGAARNADRLLNRYWDYPRALKRQAGQGAFRIYHIVDHSYSQLVHALPADRTVVTCHDLDTFRCLLEPEREPRPAWFRAFTQRTLDGFRKAAAVVCDSEATRDALIAHKLIEPSRLHVIYLGRHPECTDVPDREADAEATRLLGPLNPEGSLDILNVGSTIPRKRIDILLSVFAEIQRALPGVRLIRVGGPLNGNQEQQARDLGVWDSIISLPFCTRATLAAVYRRAGLVLMPTEAEGFGLPVAEALACGVPLLASDIAVLREVGGDAPVYRPVGDVPAWTEAALTLLDQQRRRDPAWQARRDNGLARARRYDWSNHANQLIDVYRSVIEQKS